MSLTICSSLNEEVGWNACLSRSIAELSLLICFQVGEIHRINLADVLWYCHGIQYYDYGEIGSVGRAQDTKQALLMLVLGSMIMVRFPVSIFSLTMALPTYTA